MTRVSSLALTLAIVAASAGPVFADDAAQATIETACETNLNLPAGNCPCLAAKAGNELDDTQQAWLAATLSDDTAGALAIKDQMDPAQAMQAGMFMVNGPRECAGG